MSIKKYLIYICIILLVLSMYHDLQKNLVINGIKQQNDLTNIQYKAGKMVIKKQSKPGDTILSLIEEVNGQMINEINIDKMVQDFQTVNTHINTLELKANEFYLIPIYHNKKGLSQDQP